MWDLANILLYIDSVLTIESTVNLEIDTPVADKKVHTCVCVRVCICIYICMEFRKWIIKISSKIH